MSQFQFNPITNKLDLVGSGGAGSGAWTLIQTQTASNSSSLDFTTGISSYDCIAIKIVGIKVSDNNLNFFKMLQSVNGGSTWISSGYYGGFSGFNLQSTSPSVGFGTTEFFIANPDSTNSVSGMLFFYPAGGILVGSVFYVQINGTPSPQNLQLGAVAGSPNTNAIQFSYDGGNLASGSISIYGISS